MPSKRAVAYALAAAVLFGASTPAAKILAGEMTPFLLAGLLYAGSGIGLSFWIALSMGGAWPSAIEVAASGLIGLFGYGVSLALFVVALRELGTARTSAYFSIAPFAGIVLALAALGEVPGLMFWLALPLAAAGVWLHVTESHAHDHLHEPLEHAHAHVHDEHHRHGHDFNWDGSEPHAHAHRHERLLHSHPHYPDIHHRHPH